MTSVAAHPSMTPPPPVGDAPDSRYVVTRLPVRRFTVEEYHRLIEQGFFATDERFELLEGWIVAKVSKNPPHDAHVARARRVLDQRLPPGWHIRVQSAVTTGDSEPEPDLALVRGDEMDYVARHPEAADTPLVVEVSSSTLADDRVMMGRIYARAGFPTYWIINLVDRQIEVYHIAATSTAALKAFAPARVHRPGEQISLSVGGADVGPIPVTDFLP
jgi:Uma2 family endonuclease